MAAKEFGQDIHPEKKLGTRNHFLQGRLEEWRRGVVFNLVTVVAVVVVVVVVVVVSLLLLFLFILLLLSLSLFSLFVLLLLLLCCFHCC